MREISGNTATGVGMFSGVCVAHCLIRSVHMIARVGTRINTVWQQQTAHEDVHFPTFCTRNTQSNIQILMSHLRCSRTHIWRTPSTSKFHKCAVYMKPQHCKLMNTYAICYVWAFSTSHTSFLSQSPLRHTVSEQWCHR